MYVHMYVCMYVVMYCTIHAYIRIEKPPNKKNKKASNNRLRANISPDWNRGLASPPPYMLLVI